MVLGDCLRVVVENTEFQMTVSYPGMFYWDDFYTLPVCSSWVLSWLHFCYQPLRKREVLAMRSWSGGYWIFCLLLLIALRGSWAASTVRFSSLFACTRMNLPYQFAAFGRIWAESKSYTSEFIPLLPWAITPSINTSDLLPLAVVYVHTMTPPLTNDVLFY